MHVIFVYCMYIYIYMITPGLWKNRDKLYTPCNFTIYGYSIYFLQHACIIMPDKLWKKYKNLLAKLFNWIKKLWVKKFRKTDKFCVSFCPIFANLVTIIQLVRFKTCTCLIKQSLCSIIQILKSFCLWNFHNYIRIHAKFFF